MNPDMEWIAEEILGNIQSSDATVKLLPCDHEVMGSSPGNSLLPK
jgi:hypothetical protein